MNQLSIRTFTHPTENLEHTKDQIDEKLQKIQQNFNKSILYPELGCLVQLTNELCDELKRISPYRVNGFVSQPDLHRMEDTRELIHWSADRIFRLLESGRTILDFIRNQLTLRWINGEAGALSMGYIIIPGPSDSYEQYVYKYVLHRDRGNVQDQPLLWTRRLQSFSDEVSYTDILHRLPGGDNPATVIAVETMDMFPWEPTFLPAVRRDIKPFITNSVET